MPFHAKLHFITKRQRARPSTNAFVKVSYEVDEGGNSFPVDFFGTSTNLHSVWDTQMIKRYENGSWWNIANELVAFLDDNPDVLKGYVARVCVCPMTPAAS